MQITSATSQAPVNITSEAHATFRVDYVNLVAYSAPGDSGSSTVFLRGPYAESEGGRFIEGYLNSTTSAGIAVPKDSFLHVVNVCPQLMSVLCRLAWAIHDVVGCRKNPMQGRSTK